MAVTAPVESLTPAELAELALRWMRDAATALAVTPRRRWLRRRGLLRELRAASELLSAAADLRAEEPHR